MQSLSLGEGFPEAVTLVRRGGHSTQRDPLQEQKPRRLHGIFRGLQFILCSKARNVRGDLVNQWRVISVISRAAIGLDLATELHRATQWKGARRS